MSVNKVQLANGETIIDISDSTVTPETLAEGVTAHDASGQKITGKMVPGGGSSVQSDWNQYDETAADFIKNKPFDETLVVVLEEQELPYDADQGGLFAVIQSPIQVGDALSVVLDGVTYETMVVNINGNIAFGNIGLMSDGQNAGEPFVGIYVPDISMVGLITMDTESHTVKISVSDITKLPAKYYNVQAVFWAKANDQYLYTDESMTIKAKKADIAAAVQKKQVVISTSGVIFRPAVYVNTERDYATVYTILASLGVATANLMPYYTAEYTA